VSHSQRAFESPFARSAARAPVALDSVHADNSAIKAVATSRASWLCTTQVTSEAPGASLFVSTAADVYPHETFRRDPADPQPHACDDSRPLQG
jgi:hypothetical protein